ncbi:LAME_0C07536g1_1 [Lachancea meyersii CBS 8951]|uniref:LAME_0C07536g1_1 n=1 Tax=Lachancea meyersii CBS 8951 TaxID=1266667 RepID=A0A1G4J2V5_9SACH|nr:LAME_0C07536g1_1 [Lachancea meyersii CBS 8951]
MLNPSSKFTPKILELLSKIASETTLSLTEPLMEFVDILTESLMYPRGSRESLLDVMCGNIGSLNEAEIEEKHDFVTEELGLGCLLETVHTAELLRKMTRMSKNSNFVFGQSATLEEIHCVLVNLLKQLSAQIEICFYPKFYQTLLRENVTHFRRAFEALQGLDNITARLLKNAEQQRTTEPAFLEIDAKTTEFIRIFTVSNAKWHEELLLGSRALKEYLAVKSESKNVSADSELIEEMCDEAIAVVRSPVFGNYVRVRKSKLKITHRKIF